MTYEPRSKSTDQRFFGVFEGIVTNVKDPENEGRVKVEYPWFSGNMESEWAPVMQFFAGPKHGSFFIPEEKSLVLCSCRHGDLRKPVVIGGLYNGKDKPHADHVRKREISSLNGHKITMIDSNGDNAGALILEDAGGSRISLSSNGHLVIQAKGAITLEAPVINLKGQAGWRRVVSPNSNPL